MFAMLLLMRGARNDPRRGRQLRPAQENCDPASRACRFLSRTAATSYHQSEWLGAVLIVAEHLTVLLSAVVKRSTATSGSRPDGASIGIP